MYQTQLIKRLPTLSYIRVWLSNKRICLELGKKDVIVYA